MRKTIRFLLVIGLILLMAPLSHVSAQGGSIDGCISSGSSSVYGGSGLVGSVGEPTIGLLTQGWQHFLQGFAYKTLENKIVTANNQPLVIAVQVKLFPNPVDEYLNIQYEGLISGNEKYAINDLTGRIVLSGKLNSPLTQLNVVSLRPGVYVFVLVNTSTNKSIYLNKFVKH